MTSTTNAHQKLLLNLPEGYRKVTGRLPEGYRKVFGRRPLFFWPERGPQECIFYFITHSCNLGVLFLVAFFGSIQVAVFWVHWIHCQTGSDRKGYGRVTGSEKRWPADWSSNNLNKSHIYIYIYKYIL